MDAIVNAATKLTDTLKGNLPSDLTTATMADLEQLANIIQQATKQISDTTANKPQTTPT